MKAWDEMVKCALLGTEKMPLQVAILPQNIQKILEKTDKTDSEAYFLKAAALTWTYRRAGQMPDKTPLPSISAAPDETLKFAPPQYISLLKRLFDSGTSRFPQLFILFFEKMVEKNYVLTPENVYDVLNLTTEPIYRNHKTLISRVVGERGRWLTQFNEAWQMPQVQSFDAVWAEGSSADRRLALTDYRKTDPEKAFNLIKGAWQEANAREKKDLLKILATQPQNEEWTFVQAIYDDLVQEKTPKAITQEMKEIAVGLLLNNPSSDLYKKVAERLKKYVVTKKTFLGLSSKNTLELPTESDDFLNGTVMKYEFGHGFTPSTNELLTEYWFTYFLNRMHPSVWEDLLETDDWQRILQVLEDADRLITNNRKRQRQSFKWHISTALGNHRYRQGVFACLKTGKNSDYQTHILNALSNDELEKYFIDHIDIGEVSNVRNHLLRENWRWSSTLSLYILRGIIARKNETYNNIPFAINSAAFFDSSILSELYALSKLPQSDWQLQQQHNTLIMPLIQFLEIRKEIESF
ncbi:MAG: hypothetical protein JNL70_02335 [Saprospiraceae bacterium]|nr:hypothetical protein [Saprospiraceae bacterium]